MKFTSVIFDLDGTIINTEPLWREATKRLLTHRGVEVTPEMQDGIDRKVRGHPLKRCCAIIKEMFALSDEVELLMAEEMELVAILYETHLSFIAGFPEFHARLKQKGITTAIASNCKDDVILKASRILSLEHYFGRHIYGISSVNYVAKPNPAVFLHAAYSLQTSPADCVVIEDSQTGIRAAKAAGMRCIAINTSGMTDLLKEADCIVDSFAELTDLF